jgi:Tol biopolymer transport system component
MTDMSNTLRSRIGSVFAIAAFTLLAAAALTATPALAAEGEGCANEHVRQESNTNPTTGKPYSVGLPECRAYEMVSPLEKQQHDALTHVAVGRVSVSPEGSAIDWSSQGAYAGCENYQVHASHPDNPYVAQRTASGWVTRCAYPPMNLIEDPGPVVGAAGVFSANLADESVCGSTSGGSGQGGPTILCALRGSAGLWTPTPEYKDLTGQTVSVFETVGASSTGEDVVFYDGPETPFLPLDTSTRCEGFPCGGIYEETGVGTASPELRLVNVDSSGNMIGPETKHGIGDLASEEPAGSSYQAVSADGSTIYFTATPSGGVATVYARIDGRETVAVSGPSPSECTRCTKEAEEGKPETSEPRRAVYQGASADGSKVFFTSSQQLVNSDTGEENILYEYDFANPPAHRIVEVSGGGLGDLTPGTQGVAGVVSISEDGSHVYFVSGAVLTTLPNGLGQTASDEEGARNLYVYDTVTGETKFVAVLLEKDQQLWGVYETVPGTSSNIDNRLGQATPDGRYLVFDSYAKLITAGPEADTSGAQQVYRYDFNTGNIIRASLGHEGFANNGNTPGFSADIGSASGAAEGALPTVNDTNRAISENGETIAFTSAAQLQSTDVVAGANKGCPALGKNSSSSEAGCNIYEWHNGAVSMISDGQDPNGAIYAGMSASGSDIFFQTRTQLTGQDTDSFGDIYDARVNGGFPAPTPEPSCSGEACQGAPSGPPAFGLSGTATSTAGGNLTPGSTAFPPPEETKVKPLTRAQKLAKALKQCKKDKNKKKRTSCEKEAKKKYGPVKKK